MRDKIAQTLCNFVLRHIASRDYAEKITLLIDQGRFHAISGRGPFIKHESPVGLERAEQILREDDIGKE